MREKKHGKRAQALVFLLTAAVVAGSLMLPEMVLQAVSRQRIGKIQEADTEYYSREVSSYTGDLNTYRKLLFLHGVWKSELTLEATGALSGVPYQNSGAKTAPEEMIPYWEQAVYLLETKLDQLYWSLGASDYAMEQGGVLDHTGTPSVRLYRCQDTVLGKYQFWLADLKIPLMDWGIESREPFRILMDLETGLVLSLRIPTDAESYLWNKVGIENFLYSFYSDQEVEPFGSTWEEMVPFISNFLEPSQNYGDGDFQAPDLWNEPSSVYEQGAVLWQGTDPGEKLYFVIQNDSEGTLLFFALDPEELKTDGEDS